MSFRAGRVGRVLRHLSAGSLAGVAGASALALVYAGWALAETPGLLQAAGVGVFALAVAFPVFMVGAWLIGPLAAEALLRLGWARLLPAALAGGLLTAAVSAVVLGGTIVEVNAMVAVGGAAAGATYLAVWRALEVRPRPGRPSGGRRRGSSRSRS